MENFITKFLPVIIMCECFLAVVPYLYYGKYGSALYWLSAGLINLSVVFLIKPWG